MKLWKVLKDKTDYCSSFPEGDWAHCCRRHDNDYARQNGFWSSNYRLLR